MTEGPYWVNCSIIKTLNHYMHRSLPVVLLLVCLSVLHAYPQSAAHHTVYAEATSFAPYYNIRYDKMLHQGHSFNKSFSAGIALRANDIGIPLGFHFFTGPQAPHYLELGLTLMPYITSYRQLFAGGNVADKKLYIIPGIGYRHQREEGGLFLRCILSPVFLLDPRSDDFWKMETRFNGGASIGVGYSF